MPDDFAPRRVAVIESMPIFREVDAASRAMCDLMDGLRALGHETQFWLYDDVNLMESLTSWQPDAVVLSRPPAMLALGEALRSHGLPLIYFGHDLHYLRMEREARLLGRSMARVSMLRQIERRCCLLSTIAVYPGCGEPALMNELVEREIADYFPYYWIKEGEAPAPTPSGKNLVFIGGSHHEPNVDGIRWFLAEIWPELIERHPDLSLSVCGRWQPAMIPTPIPDGVQFTGELTELEISTLLSHAIISIAPLRYGSGVKRKVVQSLAAGVPTLTTQIGAEGLAGTPDELLPLHLANSTDEWVEACTQLLSDHVLRSQLSAAGPPFVAARYGTPVFLDACASLVNRVLS